MVEIQNTRRYRRISVGSEHTVGFRINGLDLKGIPISNLSAGGCFAILPKTLVPSVRQGYLLMDFMLEHKGLPNAPFCSQVVHVVTGLPNASRSDIGLGISFLSTSPHFYEWVDTYVSAYPSSSK